MAKVFQLDSDNRIVYLGEVDDSSPSELKDNLCNFILEKDYPHYILGDGALEGQPLSTVEEILEYLEEI